MWHGRPPTVIDPRLPARGQLRDAARAQVTPDGSGWSPPSPLPHPQSVSYWRDALGLFLLLVLLPYVLFQLATNPGRVLTGRFPPT